MPPAAFIVHSLDHARAALTAARAAAAPVLLVSAPGAAGYAGCGYFEAMIRRAMTEQPGVAATALLDCGEEPGLVLGAIRHGLKAVRFAGPDEVFAKLADIARQAGAVVVASTPPALDLLGLPDPERACRDWLALAMPDDDC